jgi:hypothetical protein
MQQILVKLGEPEWWFSTVVVSILCNFIATKVLEKMKANTGPLSSTPQRLTLVRVVRSGFLMLAFIVFCVAILLSIWSTSTQVTGSGSTPPSGQPQLPNKTPSPSQKRADAAPAPADDAAAPMQSAPECPTPQSPSAFGNQTVRQLYCSMLPCYGGELDQTVLLLGEWIGLAEASLKSCNSSDRKLLAADVVFSKLSRMPDSNTGTFEARQYCSSARYNLVGKVEETMNRLQILPPKCTNKTEEASVPVVTFMQKIRR